MVCISATSKVCSLIRGSIGERSGMRVGHCIIEINGTSTVGLCHKDLVHLLTTTVGDVSVNPIIIVCVCVCLYTYT